MSCNRSLHFILLLLRKTVASELFEQYAEAEKELKRHEIWAMPKVASFQEWFVKTWLPIHQVSLMKSVCKQDFF